MDVVSSSSDRRSVGYLAGSGGGYASEERLSKVNHRLPLSTFRTRATGFMLELIGMGQSDFTTQNGRGEERDNKTQFLESASLVSSACQLFVPMTSA